MKTRWRILIGALGILAFFTLSLTILEKRSRNELQAYKAALRAKGEKLSFGELNLREGPKQPDFQKFVDTTTELSSAQSKPWEIVLFHFDAPAKVSVISAANAGDTLNSLRTDLQTFSNQFVAIHTFAKAVPLDPPWDPTDAMVSRIAFHSSKRAAAQWLSAMSIAESRSGDCVAASDHLSAAISISRLFENDAYMPSQMIQQSVALLGLYATWQVLQTPECREKDLQQIQNEWQSVDMLGRLERSFEWERAFFEGEFAAIADAPSSSPAEFLWRSVAKDNNEFIYLKYMEATLNDIRTVGEYNLGFEVLQRHHRRHRELQSRTNFLALYRSSLALLPIANFEKLLPSTVRRETFRRLTVTAIALKRYKLRHGQFPTELKALVPEFLAAVPADCMDGKPLKYKINSAGSFLLYSVGEDGIDNGGDPQPPTSTRDLDLWTGRDVVWPTPSDVN